MRVAIAGAGIAGLTLALCLARRGIPSRVFERAWQLEEAGAGLQVPPNALHILERLGLGERLADSGFAADRVHLRQLSSGRLLAEIPVASADGGGYLALHRADLQQVLLEAVLAEPAIKLQLDRELRSLDGTDFLFASSDGATHPVSADLLVAADGVRSRAATLLGEPSPRESGLEALRLTLPRALATPPETVTAWLASRAHAVAYPISGGSQTNLVIVTSAKDAASPRKILSPPRTRDPFLGAASAHLSRATVWPLLTVPRQRAYAHARDRTVLIGDAAHGLLPFAAQGAAMAIEDAETLSRVVAQAGTDERSLLEWERERRDRVGRVRRRTAFHRFVYHLPPPVAFARNAALAGISPHALRRGLAWLYDWRAPL